MRLSVVVAFCLLTVSAAIADTVVLKEGGRVSGHVRVSRTEVVVRIRPGMEVSFPKEQVKEIIFEKTAHEKFKRRIEKLAPGDAAGLYSLGLWAKAKGLKEEAARCFREVVELEPDHAGARKELGYMRHEGKWMLLEEAMRKKGLVNYKGRWVTPEEKEQLEKEGRTREVRKHVRHLITLLATGDRAAAQRAAQKYALIDDPAAVPVLAHGARHHKGQIRLLTVRTYGNFEPRLVTEPLVERAVADPRERIRAEAVKVLRKIKSRTAYIKILKDFYYNPDGDLRLLSMEALGALKDRNSVAPLIESVAYEARRVVRVSAGAPDTFVGTQSRKVIGYRRVADSFGRVVDVPIIGTVTSGFGSSGTVTKVVDDVIFNLGARLALKAITGQDFNYAKNEWRQWWKENKKNFGPFMELVKKEEPVKVPPKREKKIVREGGEYYPLKPGMAWTYSSGRAEALVNVSRIEKYGCRNCFVVETVSGARIVQRQWLYFGGDYLYLAKDWKPRKVIEYDPPFPVAKFPFKKGQRWQWAGRISGRKVSYSFWIKGKKSVTVPAGRLAGLEVQSLVKTGRTLRTVTEIFAPGVGLVYQEREPVGRRKKPEVLELVSFTPPEE